MGLGTAEPKGKRQLHEQVAQTSMSSTTFAPMPPCKPTYGCLGRSLYPARGGKKPSFVHGWVGSVRVSKPKIDCPTAVSLKDSREKKPFQWAELWIAIVTHSLCKERGPKVRIFLDLTGSAEWLGWSFRGLERDKNGKSGTRRSGVEAHGWN